jgi:hypothetical protein
MYILEDRRGNEIFTSEDLEEVRSRVIALGIIEGTDLYHIVKEADERVTEVISVMATNHTIYAVEDLPLELEALRRRLRAPEPEKYRWVTVYDVSREYGGPEEGGWWYDCWSVVEEQRVLVEEAEAVKKSLEEEYRDDLDDLQVVIEKCYRERETRRKPHYE